MADSLQAITTFVADHWISITVGLLILLIYRYVRFQTVDSFSLYVTSAVADSNMQKIIHLECYCLAVSLKFQLI